MLLDEIIIPRDCPFKKRGSFLTREESSLQEIQPDEFHMKMQDPNFLEEAQLIDVREPEEVYASISCFLNKS